MAKDAHNAYVTALEAHGTSVTVLPPLPRYPDSCFVEDTAVMIDEKAIISNMGHPSRIGEEVAVLEYLADDYEIIRMPENCKLDGGDVVFYDDCFLIGLSTRTNKEGANFLKKEIKKSGYGVKYIKIPESTLHLTTVCFNKNFFFQFIFFLCLRKVQVYGLRVCNPIFLQLFLAKLQCLYQQTL